MRILLIDDHALFRSGLKFLLSDLEDSLEFSEARSVSDSEQYAPDVFDLILLDWNLPGITGSDGLQALKERFADTTIVVLSGEEDPELVRKAIDLGAAGFIPKASIPAVLISALRLILAGGIYLPAQLLMRAGGYLRKPDGSELYRTEPKLSEQLTPRQLDALMLAVKGKSNKQIARDLAVSEGTIKQHLSTAFRLLGVSNRTEAVYAVASRELSAGTLATAAFGTAAST